MRSKERRLEVLGTISVQQYLAIGNLHNMIFVYYNIRIPVWFVGGDCLVGPTGILVKRQAESNCGEKTSAEVTSSY